MGKKILVKNHLTSEVGAGALERERAKKKECKKAKAPSVKEKSANSLFFIPPQWKSGFRAQSHLAGGKKGLE